MSINGIGTTGYPMAGYGTRKTEKNVSGGNFAKQAAEAVQASGQATAILHGSDEETGDIAVFSCAVLVNNSSITVYKTPDFDPNNPVYKVKTWDKDGNVTERMVDVSKVDPKNCDTVDMFAYAANLKESGKGNFEETVGIAVSASTMKYDAKGDYSSYSLFAEMNWVDIVKDIMQQQYNFGNMKGYLEWKTFLGLLEESK